MVGVHGGVPFLASLVSARLALLCPANPQADAQQLAAAPLRSGSGAEVLRIKKLLKCLPLSGLDLVEIFILADQLFFVERLASPKPAGEKRSDGNYQEYRTVVKSPTALTILQQSNNRLVIGRNKDSLL